MIWAPERDWRSGSRPQQLSDSIKLSFAVDCSSTAPALQRHFKRDDLFIGIDPNRQIVFLARNLPKIRAACLALESWKHFVDHRDGGGPNEYNENTGKNEYNEGEDQLDRRLRRLFLGDLTTSSPH